VHNRREVIFVVYAVILAGGTGERFWPLSRQDNPKQFLRLFGEQTMLQQTVSRVAGLIEPDHIYVVTGEQYHQQVVSQLTQLPLSNIICEPFGRDTAPAVGLAAEYIYRRDPGGTMLILPADHYITNVRGFHECLAAAFDAAAGGDWLVTIGIRPSEPATGYGYIRMGEVRGEYAGIPVHSVLEFKEKPDIERAKKYIEEGNYLWNSGMFIWRVDLIRSLFLRFLPNVARGLEAIGNSLGTPEQSEVLMREYQRFPRISVDYGILEKCSQVLVIPARFDWDDVGSWTSWQHYQAADENGNVHQSRGGVFLDTRNSLIYSPEQVVAALGVEDLIVVNTDDCLLVCHRDRAQDIKKVVEELKRTGYHAFI